MEQKYDFQKETLLECVSFSMFVQSLQIDLNFLRRIHVNFRKTRGDRQIIQESVAGFPTYYKLHNIYQTNFLISKLWPLFIIALFIFRGYILTRLRFNTCWIHRLKVTFMTIELGEWMNEWNAFNEKGQTKKKRDFRIQKNTKRNQNQYCAAVELFPISKKEKNWART